MTSQQVGGGNFGPPRNGNTNGITRRNTSTITPGGNTASIGSSSRISTNISIHGQGQGQQQQVQQQQQQQQVQQRTPLFVPPGFTPNPNSNTHVTQGGFNGAYTARGQEFGGAQSAPMPIGILCNQVTATASDNPLTPHSVETTTMEINLQHIVRQYLVRACQQQQQHMVIHLFQVVQYLMLYNQQQVVQYLVSI